MFIPFIVRLFDETASVFLLVIGHAPKSLQIYCATN